MSPSGIWRHVICYKLTDYLEENAASNFRVEEEDASSTMKMEAARLSKSKFPPTFQGVAFPEYIILPTESP